MQISARQLADKHFAYAFLMEPGGQPLAPLPNLRPIMSRFCKSNRRYDVDQPAQSVKSYESVAQAALDLGHKSYSGTVAATLRRDETDESR